MTHCMNIFRFPCFVFFVDEQYKAFHQLPTRFGWQTLHNIMFIDQTVTIFIFKEICQALETHKKSRNNRHIIISLQKTHKIGKQSALCCTKIWFTNKIQTSATNSTFLRDTFKSIITLNDASDFHCLIISMSSIGKWSESVKENSKSSISLASSSCARRAINPYSAKHRRQNYFNRKSKDEISKNWT